MDRPTYIGYRPTAIVSGIKKTGPNHIGLSPPDKPPPPQNLGAAASRISYGAPASQPELTSASRKTVGGAAEGSSWR